MKCSTYEHRTFVHIYRSSLFCQKCYNFQCMYLIHILLNVVLRIFPTFPILSKLIFSYISFFIICCFFINIQLNSLMNSRSSFLFFLEYSTYINYEYVWFHYFSPNLFILFTFLDSLPFLRTPVQC